MIQNLSEHFLYDRLPQAVINGDERGLIEAVLGGFSDRLEDVRSHARKLGDFWTPGALPDGPNNAILADVAGDYGKTYTRSLDFQPDTPAAAGAALTAWAAQQLKVPADALSNVRYGRDLLRLVDSNLLSYLGATLGCVLYQNGVLTDAQQKQASVNLVETWFPRLKIKGTIQSFEVLGRLLGFDDVRVTPLWTRLSPRQPDDVGNAANDPDFAANAEYLPKQAIDTFYDPFAYRDGPFFSWQTVVDNGTASSSFYTQTVNGFNPWINVVLLGSLSGTNVPATVAGTVTHPVSGDYVLAGGLPNFKAYVEPPLSSVGFQAVSEGDAFNGVTVHVSTSGSLATLSIVDRLSAIKYRSSYFDIGLSSTMDRMEEIFGSRAATTNKDLAGTHALTSDGTAVSPYRPWTGGTVGTPERLADWVVDSGGTMTTARVPRYEADPTVTRQLNVDSALAAGVQVIQAFEEVRPATRQPRRSQFGFLFDDKAQYAPYIRRSTLFTAGTAGFFSGVAVDFPWVPYVMNVEVFDGTGSQRLSGEYDASGTVLHFSGSALSGTYDLGSADFGFACAAAGTVYGLWLTTSTEVIRPAPAQGTLSESYYSYIFDGTAAATGTVYTAGSYQSDIAYQARPEDQEGDQSLVDEVADDFGWRRDIVAGGELEDIDISRTGTEIAIDAVDAMTVFNDHTGVDLNVFGVPGQCQPMRVMMQARPTDETFKPGNLAIGYQGSCKDLGSLNPADLSVIRLAGAHSHGDTSTDYDLLFEPGYKLFHVGVAQGVLVADLPVFFGAHHRDGLVGWFALNEHPEDNLAPADHSSIGVSLAQTGLVYTSRQWDDERGWCLRLNNGTLASDRYREIETEATVSFWIKVESAAAPETVVSAGPLSVTCAASVLTAQINSLPIGTQAVTLGQWMFVYIRANQTQAWANFSNLGALGVEQLLPGNFTLANSAVIVQAAATDCQLHDLRLWNVCKTPAQMDKVRYHRPTPTLCTYPLGYFYTSDRQDRAGIRVLPSGWAVPGEIPAWYRRSKQGWVRRYDSMGMYYGESRYKETGLGGQRALPPVYKLGQQFTAMTGAGTAPFSTASGYLPGYNAFWASHSNSAGSEAVGGVYAKLVYDAGAVAAGTGFAVTFADSGTAAPWPNFMEQTNTFCEAIWAKSAQDGYVYEITLDGSGASTYLEAKRVVRGRTAEEVALDPIWGPLADNGTFSGSYAGGIVSGTIVNNSGTLFFQNGSKVFNVADLYVSEQPTGPLVLNIGSLTGGVPYDGTSQQTAHYMYLNSRINVLVDNAYETWTDRGAVTAQDNSVDCSGNPLIVYMTGSGTYLNTPVIGVNGMLEFQNTGTLLPGNYLLTVESGNVGQPDADFRGFDVDIHINSTVISRKLLSGLYGYNVRGKDAYEVTVVDGANGNWLLSFEWTNALQDASKGTKRQLAIYGYELRRLSVELFRVDISPATAPSLPVITPLLDLTNPSVPGGWFAAINSYGSVAHYRHESVVYTSSDTVTNKQPVSNVLTSLTNDRREDVIYTGTDILLANPPDYVFPTFFGSIAVAPVPSGGLFQVGDTGTLSVAGSGSLSAIYSYVWTFWDNTSTATEVPTVTKIINAGSNPIGYPQGLQVTCTPVAFDGQSVVIYGTLYANSPPVIVPGAYVTRNDAYFSYPAQIGLTAFDFNNDAMIFNWYYGAQFLGHGTSSSAGYATGSWTGNGTTVIGQFNATHNVFDTVISTPRTLTCVITDARSGTTSLDFLLRGQNAPGLLVSGGAGVNGLIVDITAVPVQRIGVGQTMEFTAYAKDPAGGNLQFYWEFYGSNGWTMGPVQQTGHSTVLLDGGVQNTITRDISTEVVSSGIQKECTAICDLFSVNPSTGEVRTVEAQVAAMLTINLPPTEVNIVRVVDDAPIGGVGPVPNGKFITFEAAGSDPNNDWVSFMWEFAPAVDYANLLWGPKVIVDTGSLAGQALTGLLTSTDTLGGSFTQLIPETDII